MKVRSPSILLVALTWVPLAAITRDATTMIRIPGMAFEVDIVLGEGTMTTETMILESETILDRSGKDYPFIKVQFAESYAMLKLHYSMDICPLSQEFWARTKERWNSQSMRYAELISIRGNAVLRIRDGLEVKTIVLRGQNPLVRSFDGRRVEYVHFGMSYFDTTSKVRSVVAFATVQKGELNAELAKLVVSDARSLVDPGLSASVHMREDRLEILIHWFAPSLLFDLDPPPRGEEWSRTPSARCGINRLGKPGYCEINLHSRGGFRSFRF